MDNKSRVNLRNVIVNELYKPVRINYPTRRVEIRGFGDLLMFDLADLQKLKKYNRGFSYFLLGIDVFTRKIFTEALKSKSSKEVAEAAIRILKRAKIKYKLLQTDSGKEFMGKDFQEKVVQHFNLKHYTTKTGRKAVFAERYIRSLKVLIYKNLDLLGSNEWLPLLQKLTNEINNRKHSTLGIVPNKITKRDEKFMMDKFYSKPRAISQKTRFKIGDQVRISRPPPIFRRAFMPYWSMELFTVKAINRKYPNVYVLEDFEGNELKRKYYQEELQKTKAKNIWLVDKVIKKKGNKLLVRFFGFSEKYDQWVDKKDFYEIKK